MPPPPNCYDGPVSARIEERLSGRERVLLALDHKETDRVPIAQICSGFNKPVWDSFDELLRRERGVDINGYLGDIIDVQYVEPAYIGPALRPGEDFWGVVRKPISYGLGSYDEIERFPLGDARTVDDLGKHRWPSPDWFDFSVIPARAAALRARRDCAIIAANGNIFESSWYMRGFEQTLQDFIEEPEIAHALLERVTDFHCEYFRRLLGAANGAVDLVFTADDIAGQQGLLVSLGMWQTFIKPLHKRLNRIIHGMGAKVVYHSDGDITDAVEGLMDMGIDVLEALQFSAGKMDPAVLKAKGGNRLSFAGGVSVQTTLPFGTADQVRAEVETLIRTLGKGGGYILGPSHLIQAGTPPENVLAMFETARGYYPFGR